MQRNDNNNNVNMFEEFLDVPVEELMASAESIKNNSLLLAITSNDYEHCVDAIHSGADVNTKSKDGSSYLHAAVKYNADLQIIDLLIDKGADVNAADSEGFTILHRAISTKSVQLVNLLLYYKDKININAQNNDGYTPLHMAVENNNLTSVQQILNTKKGLLTINNTCAETKDTALHMAVRNGFTDIVALLIEKGADLNALNLLLTPLHEALETSHYEIAEMLIHAGANVNAIADDKSTALHRAINNEKMVEILIAHGASIRAKTTRLYTPLHFACQIPNNAKIIKILIDYKADVNAIAESGYAPLFFAAQLPNNLEVIKLLVENNANVNVRTKNFFYTPLHVAASVENNADVIHFLVKKGAQVHAQDKSHYTPLHFTYSIAKKSKAKFLESKFKKSLNEILVTENLDPFKKQFEELDNGLLSTAEALIECGANTPSITSWNVLSNHAIRNLFNSINKAKAKKPQPEEKKKTADEIAREQEIVQQKKQKQDEKKALQQKQAEEAARAAAKPIHEIIKEMFASTTIGLDYDETNQSYTFKFKTNDSYQFFKGMLKKQQLLKNIKLEFPSALSIRFTLDADKAKKVFKDDNNFSNILYKEIIDKNPAAKENSPKLTTKVEGELEWDTAFKANWQNYIKNIFPFDIAIDTKNDLSLEVSLVQFNEHTQKFANLLEKHLKEANVTYKDNKIIIKPENKPVLISYKDVPQPSSFENTYNLKKIISKEINSNKSISTTSQIIEKTTTKPAQTMSNKEIEEKNKNVNTHMTVAVTDEDKAAFKLKIKAFMNDISGNILTDKLDYFKINRINQNLTRIEMHFDLKAYSSLSTETTPTGSIHLLKTMQQAVNKVLGHEVMMFDEKENSIKFFFSKIDKAEMFKHQAEIANTFNELEKVDEQNDESENKIPSGKQEMKSDNNNINANTNEDDDFTIIKLFNEIHLILVKIKTDKEKSANLLALLKILNSYSPTKNANDEIAFTAYKLLATYTLNVLSQEKIANSDTEPQIYNLRNITRHAYSTYDWQQFHECFSPFFAKLEEISIQLFNSTPQVTQTLYKQKLLPSVALLNDELQLFAPFLKLKLLQGNSSAADLKSFQTQIAILKSELNNNGLNEKTIQSICFAILQLCCEIGEKNNPAYPLENTIYGELHKANLKNDAVSYLLDLYNYYFQKATPRLQSI